MRTHAEIIRAVGEGVLADLTGAPLRTVLSWARRDSIPSKHWEQLVGSDHCTADELMAAAAKRVA